MPRRWTLRLLTAAALAGAPSALLAADEPAGPDHSALFKKLDADGDGQIGKDEVPDDQRRLLERLIANHDKNADGKLSAAEFAAGLAEDRPRGDMPPPGGGGRPGGGQFEPGEFFRRMDRNGDGKITPDEVPEDRRAGFMQMLSRVDEDGDGAATLDEFRKGFGPRPGEPARPGEPGRPGQPRPDQPRLGMPPMPGGGELLLRVLDADGNGELSADEIAGAAAALKKLDRNGDGKITRDEVGPPPPFGRPGQPGQSGRPGQPPEAGRPDGRADGERARAYFKQFDKDGDGKLSKDEAPERMRENFGRLDTNGDGFVDDAELKQLVERMQQAVGAAGRRPEGARPAGRPPEASTKPVAPAKPDAPPKKGDRAAKSE